MAEGDTEAAAACFVHVVGLGVAGLAATVDHIVELFTIGSIEDSR
jgi:hypothetical protein